LGAQQSFAAQHEGSAAAQHEGSAAHEGAAAAQVASQQFEAQQAGLQQRCRWWQRCLRQHVGAQQSFAAQHEGSAAAQHEGSGAQHEGSQQPLPPKMRACAFEALTTNRPATSKAGNKIRFMDGAPKQILEGFPLSFRATDSHMPLAHCSA
jgi:hypothetical protein